MIGPVRRWRNWPLVKPKVVAEIATSPHTGPSPLFGDTYKTGAEWVPFNVPADAKEVNVALNGDGPVSALIDRSGACGSVICMPTLGMSARQPMHKPRKLLVRRPHNKMPVVRHGTICQQANREPLHGLHQDAFERPVIERRLEQSCTANGPIEHVIHETSRWTARSSGHSRMDVFFCSQN
jgi:hypothetical protein